MNHALLAVNGRLYEQMAVGWLEDHGIAAEHVGDHRGHDVETADGLRIEVKGSRLQDLGNHRHGYQFLLHRAGKGPHAPSDVHLLLCLASVSELAVFVIPSREIAERSAIMIPNPVPARYRGKYRVYLECVDPLRR